MWISIKASLVLALMTFGSANAGAEVLVFGGTGRLGAPIVKLLIERGYSVTVFARMSSDRFRLADSDVTYITGDNKLLPL